MANFSNWLASNQTQYNSIQSQQSTLAGNIASLNTFATTLNQETNQLLAEFTSFSANSGNLVQLVSGAGQETIVTQTHVPLNAIPSSAVTPGSTVGVYSNNANFTSNGYNVSKPLFVTVSAGEYNNSGGSTVRAYVSNTNGSNQPVSNFLEVAFATQGTSGNEISNIAFCVPANGSYFVVIPTNNYVMLWNEFIMD